MASPTVGTWKALKRIARYLIHKPRMIMLYEWQGRESEIVGYTDSDWAGCRMTGKTISGGCVMRGSHFYKGWCKTQQCVTISSAEAELVASNKTAADVLGIISMLVDLGESGKGKRVCYGLPKGGAPGEVLDQHGGNGGK